MAAHAPWLSVMDAFAVPLLRLDAAGRVRVHNTAWATLMGETPAGTEVASRVHPEDREAWHEALRAGRSGSGTAVRRLRFVHPRGGLRWLDVSLAEADAGVAMTAHDATAQQRHETALLVAAHSTRGLLDGLPALVYRGRNDRDWTMEVLSDGCLELTGYPASRLIDGRDLTYSSLIAPDDAEYVWDAVQAALREHRPYSLCYRIRCADGRMKCIVEKGRGVYADNGEVLGIEGVVLEPGEEILGRLTGLRGGDLE